ncbi:hypothetical protein IGS68_31750 (plasmid) [Skermanella sp. TT6]|uniref:Uncharacterized protein n=1 Tax=Skermanella cutis TaxID=2775420 RepID=A0ABX7BGU1_9PROT|nr:hypothetical protein [Skermanella sp. TT6]QQP93600.1 hypothetical protein IGS68_31750 [Skermanella sp. TT6]
MAGSFEPPAGSISRSDDPESGGTDSGAPSEADSMLSGPASPAGPPDPAPAAYGIPCESAPMFPAPMFPAPAPLPDAVPADAAPAESLAESPAAPTGALPAAGPDVAPQPAPDAVTASASALGSVTGLGLAAFVGGGFLMMGLGAAVGAYYSVALAEQYVRRVGGLGRPGAA